MLRSALSVVARFGAASPGAGGPEPFPDTFHVEDIHVEHSRNAPFGRLELAVQAERATELVERLEGAGWVAYRRS